MYIHITNVFVFWAKYITLALKYLFIKSIFKTVINLVHKVRVYI